MTVTDLYPISLPHKLYTAEQVREAEPLAAQAAGVLLYTLMERAGAACFRAIRQRWPNRQRLLILCGHGNNGGDGYVIARLAKQQGYGVQLVQIGDVEQLKGDAAQAKDKWFDIGGSTLRFEEANWEQADIIVDALLGTGLHGEVREPYRHLIQEMNQCGKPVCSVDVPSGLCGTSGRVKGIAVHADMTVTFVGRKRGLFTGKAADHVGQLIFEDLGIRQPFTEQLESNVEQIRYANLKFHLRPRPRTFHKGNSGRVFVIGGDLGTPGAIRLAAEACQRSGAGLVNVISRPEHVSPIMADRPELMVTGAQTASPKLRQRITRADVIVIGPGLGQEHWGSAMLAMALETDKPIVVDGDALNLLAHNPVYREQWVLTPHPLEAARLLGISVHDVEQDRFAAVSALQSKFGGVCLIKGAGTVITDGQTVRVCTSGNPGMASGGMGDILTGIVGGLLAQGIPIFDAVSLAVCLHGDAGDLAAEAGERGMLASDLFPHIRRLVNPSSE